MNILPDHDRSADDLFLTDFSPWESDAILYAAQSQGLHSDAQVAATAKAINTSRASTITALNASYSSLFTLSRLLIGSEELLIERQAKASTEDKARDSVLRVVASNMVNQCLEKLAERWIEVADRPAETPDWH